MKKISIVFLIFCGLILTISAVSAADNTNDTPMKENSNLNILKNESSITAQNTSQKANTTTASITKTSVSTPDLGFVYKQKSYMKITVKNKTSKKPIKNLKIKIKVYTSKKYKVYTIKTNSLGIAKLPTKNLKLGFHKFAITSANSTFKVSKKDILFIGKKKSITLKMNQHRKLKSGDEITAFVEKKNAQNKKGVYTDVWYAGTKSSIDPKYTMIYKAKLFFKNKNTGKVITKTTKGKLFTYNGEVHRSLPSTNLIPGYIPTKAKIWYLTSK